MSIAKKNNFLYIENKKLPIILNNNDEIVFLIQKIRDEAHRFAINYHKYLRDNNMTKSILDEIPGIGIIRKNKLLDSFKNVDNIKKAKLEDILKIIKNKKVSKNLFQKIKNYKTNWCSQEDSNLRHTV